AGRSLDGQPVAVLDDHVHAPQRVHDAAALRVILGDIGKPVHGISLRWLLNSGQRRRGTQPDGPPAAKRPGDQTARDGEHDGQGHGAQRDGGGQVDGDGVGGGGGRAREPAARAAGGAGGGGGQRRRQRVDQGRGAV